LIEFLPIEVFSCAVLLTKKPPRAKGRVTSAPPQEVLAERDPEQLSSRAIDRKMHTGDGPVDRHACRLCHQLAT
jgi:hypothetical protein